MGQRAILRAKPPPVITVQRKVTPLGTRCWFFSGGVPVEMAERIAVQGARRGQVRIRTVGDDPRARHRR